MSEALPNLSNGIGNLSSDVGDVVRDMSEFEPPMWAMLLTAILAVIISIIGFLGNILTILALPYTRKLRNSATWFVINLAATEILFCLTVLPMSAANILHVYSTGERIFGVHGCRLFVFLRYVIIQTELLSIAAIAINRCVLISIPKMYPILFTNRNTLLFISAIWMTSAIIMLIPLIEVYGSFSYNHYTNECDFSDDSASARKTFLLLGFLIPCCIIISSYSYIFYKSRQSSRRMQAMSATSNECVRPATGLRKRDMRIARTIAVIFLVFIVCCTPVTIAHYYGGEGKIPTLLLLLHPLYWLQYCLNCFIYAFMNRQYRDAYITYISLFWPRFRVITQRCNLPQEEDTSASHAASRKNLAERVRNSLQLSPGSSEGKTPDPRETVTLTKLNVKTAEN